MTADDHRRAALVVNPVKADAPRLQRLLVDLSNEAGWAEPEIIETSVDDPGQQATRRALDGAAAVLVAGGDGTVRAVSEAMARSEVPLAIIPSGTGNLLARNLGLPLADPRRMIRAVFEGDVHDVDVGWAEFTRDDGSRDEHAFVVLAGIGLDADMIANTRPALKKSMGWVAYVDGAARSLTAAEPFRVVYSIDDERLHSVKVQSMLFANCGTLPAGIALIPDASIADGGLDVAVIQPRGPFGWLAVWRTVWWQNSVLRRTETGRRMIAWGGQNRSVRYLRGASAEAAATEARPVELDGDEFGEAVRIRCRIDPGALRIVFPAGMDVARL
ncbi:diacylglycerol kinase family protein [Microbacterium pseudoresistens]|uniref:Diacylglycerol kinase family enzyme n=1 Tax=Microbacterium pseudoresistens TaxID=640634 RepID=A0A7Y9EV88_9MICO|nr:diacylglycerol kinase family protein [Microbacterium pseudoresistens]NYD53705.1 diacylglycerol kinase family enzyme [Microbacterium pseudoresistens]